MLKIQIAVEDKLFCSNFLRNEFFANHCYFHSVFPFLLPIRFLTKIVERAFQNSHSKYGNFLVKSLMKLMNLY